MGGAAGGIFGSVVSTGIGAFSQYRAVQAENEAAEYNAKGYEMQADSARTRGAFDLSLLQRDQAQKFGQMQQGIANAGVQSNSGSAIRMLSEQRGLDERGQQVQKYNTEMDAFGYLQKASMARSQKRSAWGGALQTLVGGFGSISKQYNQYRMLTGSGGGASPCSLGGGRCGYP